MLGELDDKFYSCEENAEALLAQYAMKTKKHLTTKK